MSGKFLSNPIDLYLRNLGAVCLIASLPTGVWAADQGAASTGSGGGDLATAATNPVGSANQFQLQYLYADESNNASGSANTAIIQPIVTFALPEGSYFQSIVTRWTIPYISTPDVDTPFDFSIDEEDWGDTLGLIFPTHTTPGEKAGEFTTWGPGLAVSIPTSGGGLTDAAPGGLTGNDTWAAGPGIVFLKNKVFANGNSLMYGGAAWHLWDIENGKADVSVTSGFPAIIYKYKELFGQKGWYLRTTDDAFSYNHETSEWTQVPLGGGIGRAFVIGKQPVNIFGAVWTNGADPDEASTPEWAAKISFSFVFPK